MSSWRTERLSEEFQADPATKLPRCGMSPPRCVRLFFAFLFNHGGANTTTNTSARGAVNKFAQ